jgi:hypothetical protein
MFIICIALAWPNYRAGFATAEKDEMPTTWTYCGGTIYPGNPESSYPQHKHSTIFKMFKSSGLFESWSLSCAYCKTGANC